MIVLGGHIRGEVGFPTYQTHAEIGIIPTKLVRGPSCLVA